ncbi:nucleotidyltransferase family protein [Dechloromonas sp. HYN0024]|uniref:nucleotidyltransferase family protein n=1 Tax=Dechloromonas sp. HYN0024 TaxID=2231055 RepID=UPI000E44C7BE|nr:nucleotidyltransferase domain-containing protein [Dechloromonas sp. HYN0024]AXS80803.1 nucleotidyltransferase domain-containing protein [Dechloromonas sp. HYN0024]
MLESGHSDAFGLPMRAREQIVAVLSDYPEVINVTVFGSRAKGNYRPGSDIDLCLDAPELGMRRRLELENRLDDLLLPWKIDVLLRHEIDNPALIDHIARVGLAWLLPQGR